MGMHFKLYHLLLFLIFVLGVSAQEQPTTLLLFHNQQVPCTHNASHIIEPSLASYNYQILQYNTGINRSNQNMRVSKGFYSGGGILFGIGTGLLIGGLSILNPKNQSSYTTGRILILSGMAGVSASIPLVLLGSRYHHQGNAARSKNFQFNN